MYLKDYDKVKFPEFCIQMSVFHLFQVNDLRNSGCNTFNAKNITLQAKESLKQAIAYSRNDLSYIMLGKIYLMEGDIHMAIDVYKRAIE